MKKALVFIIGLMLTFEAAAVDTWSFKNEKQEQRYRETISQLRCPKCQNSSIADSTAPVAADMRHKAYEMILQGKSSEQITAAMVERYGNFISYSPPVQADTLPLWILPGLFLILALAVVGLNIRHIKKSAPREYPTPELDEPSPGKMNRLWILPAVAVALALTAAMVATTSSYGLIRQQQRDISFFPELWQQMMDPQAAPLTTHEVATLGTGLRHDLQLHPDNYQRWQTLSRIYTVLHQPDDAAEAMRKAWLLMPSEVNSTLNYARALIATKEEYAVRRGCAVLSNLLKVEKNQNQDKFYRQLNNAGNCKKNISHFERLTE